MRNVLLLSAFVIPHCIQRSRGLRIVSIIALTALCLQRHSSGQSDTANSAIKIIAHRGASGYCIEHSEGAKVLAHAMKVPYIEQDVVMTKDFVFVVSHDVTMESTTNVADVYPGRNRPDGKFYYVDFTWPEVQKLSLISRSNRDATPVSTKRDVPGPNYRTGARPLRLEDEISLLRSLDQSFSRQTGLYIELKGAAFTNQELNVDMGQRLVQLLTELQVDTSPEACLIQSFEPAILERLHFQQSCPYKLIQLLGGQPEKVDLDRIAKYAYGIGPSLAMVARKNSDATSEKDSILSTGLVEQSHARGLKVHPYTVRLHQQPSWSDSIRQTHWVLVKVLQVDGFFSDFPDLSMAAAESFKELNAAK